MLGVVGLVAAAVGLACLNYTNGFGLEHHTQWASEHGMPAPSYRLFVTGAVLSVLGGVTIGWVIGRSGRGR